MKLHVAGNASLNTVTGYGQGYVEINRQRFETAIVFEPTGSVRAWSAASFETLEAADFAALLETGPDVVLLGTGARQRFPHPRLTAALAAARIGLEVMDTRAACRTYNILMSEDRKVLAALLPP